MEVQRHAPTTSFRVFVFSWRPLGAAFGALAVTLSMFVAPALAQSQIVNARIDTRPATRGIDGEIRSVAAQGADGVGRVSGLHDPRSAAHVQLELLDALRK